VTHMQACAHTHMHAHTFSHSHTHTLSQVEDEMVHTTRTALLAVFAAQAVLLGFALKLRLSSVLKQQDVKLSSWQREGIVVLGNN